MLLIFSIFLGGIFGGLNTFENRAYSTELLPPNMNFSEPLTKGVLYQLSFKATPHVGYNLSINTESRDSKINVHFTSSLTSSYYSDPSQELNFSDYFLSTGLEMGIHFADSANEVFLVREVSVTCKPQAEFQLKPDEIRDENGYQWKYFTKKSFLTGRAIPRSFWNSIQSRWYLEELYETPGPTDDASHPVERDDEPLLRNNDFFSFSEFKNLHYTGLRYFMLIHDNSCFHGTKNQPETNYESSHSEYIIIDFDK